MCGDLEFVRAPVGDKDDGIESFSHSCRSATTGLTRAARRAG